jgi:hypothetical protein
MPYLHPPNQKSHEPIEGGHMASATELLSEAQDLTKRAEELEGDIARRREKFEASIAADESKLRDAKAEAQGKIQEAMRLMGASAPLARVRTSTRRTTGRRQTIDRDAVVEWLKLIRARRQETFPKEFGSRSLAMC